MNGAATMSAVGKDNLRNSRWSRGLWGAVVVGTLVSATWVSHAADEAAATGLRGVVPAAVPVGLTASTAGLPATWQPWGEGLTADLTTLYEKEGLDVAAQRKAIAALEARLKTVNTSLADPRFRSISNPLISLSGGLKRRLDVAKAALDTLEMGPDVKTARVASARQDVARSATALENDLRSIRGGDAWVKYLQLADVKAAGSDDARASEALTAVQGKIRSQKGHADAKVRSFVERPSINDFSQAIDSYLAAVAAPAPAPNDPALRKSLGELLAAIEEYELTHSAASAAAVRKGYDAARGLAPDGGEKLTQALRTNYFNYNLRIVATEAFLNRLVAQRQVESGGVVDYILGANVSGNQTTATDVSINLVPSANLAQFDIVANGAISSSTVGVTDQAQVYTQGNHHFTAAKRVLFNGDRFWTQPARINVSAHNMTTGADTNYGIFSGIANGIAVRRAEEMRPQSEAIAASRVQDNVLPKFNSEVDKEFGPNGSINPKFSERVAALRELQLYPDAKSWTTTDSELRAMTRLMAASELGGSEPSPALVLGRGVTILVHDSLLNNSTDRLDLKGQTLTDAQLKAKIEEHLAKLLGRPVELKDDKPANDEESDKSLIFAKEDAIRFQAADGILTVTLQAGLKQEGKEEIPTQLITIPLKFSVDMKNVVIEPGNVSVSPVDPPGNAATQVARAGVIKKKIEAAFPKRTIDRMATIDSGKTKANVYVTRIKPVDGWLSVTFE